MTEEGLGVTSARLGMTEEGALTMTAEGARSGRPVYHQTVATGDFLLRVRGARETRLFRFQGDEAAKLHRLRESGHFERPGGTTRLNELIQGRRPDSAVDGAASQTEDAHFDMVADDELRGYLSQRLLERKGAAEGGGGAPGDRGGSSTEPPNSPSA